MKDRFIMILFISNMIFVLLWSGASVSSNKQRKLATDKAFLSMELEEKNARLEKEKSALASELKELKDKFVEEKAVYELKEKTLSQEQVASKALKAELERVTRLNETLENDLKEVLGSKRNKRDNNIN